MPRNGTGTYTLPQSPFVPGTTISSAAVNSDFADIATALTGSLPRDGQAGMTGQFKSSDGSTASPGLTFVAEPSTGFSRPGAGVIGVNIGGTQIGTFSVAGWSGAISSGIVPVGVVADFTGGSLPAQWLLCNGAAWSRTTYALLFAALGTTFGSGDGVTTFNIPDLRGRATFGIDGGVGRLTSTYFGGNPLVMGGAGGAQSQILTTAQMPSHGHGVNDPTHNHSTTAMEFGAGSPFVVVSFSGYPGQTGSIGFSGTGISIAAAGSGGAHTIVSPGMTVNKIIYAGA